MTEANTAIETEIAGKSLNHKSSKDINETTDLGIDVGFRNLKSQVRGEASGKINIPSFVSKVIDRDSETSKNIFISPEGERWLVGDQAIATGDIKDRVIDSQYFREESYRILVLYAISELRKKRGGVRIATGLPVEYYKKYRLPLAEAFKSMSSEIKSVMVFPQPIGTIVDLCYDWDGKLVDKDLEGHRSALVDIGQGTIDAIEIQNMRENRKKQGQRNEGVHIIHNGLNNILRTKYKMEISRADMDAVIRKGHMLIRGDKVELAKEIKPLKQTLVNSIMSLIEDTFGGISRPERIIFTGGGANFLKKDFQTLQGKKDWFGKDQLVFPEDPVMANARGFTKLLAISDRR